MTNHAQFRATESAAAPEPDAALKGDLTSAVPPEKSEADESAAPDPAMRAGLECAAGVSVEQKTSDVAHPSDLVASFKLDLATGVVKDVIRKHITTGDPLAISRDEYFELRRRVAHKFDLHPTSVVVVGSCRLGFSLKAKGKEKKRFGPFTHASDIDVAVVSAALFDDYWDKVFDRVRTNRNWAIDNGRKFTRDLFCGWITPSDLPNLPRFENARDWAEFFAELTRSRLCGLRTISARLYRTWERLELYQEINVLECKRELQSEIVNDGHKSSHL